MTETATVEAPEEIVISDGSHLAENAKTKVKNALDKTCAFIVRVPGVLKESAEVFSGISLGRVTVRRNILLTDNEPDWAGKSQLYKHTIHQGEKEAMSVLSDDEKKTLDSNVRSHTRRTVLEPVIVRYSMDRLGMTGTPPEPSASPKLANEVRRQYERADLAIPERWKSDPGGNGGGPGNGAVETPLSKVNAAAIALKEVQSAPERIGYLHKMATEVFVDLCEINKVIPGGRKTAADATNDLKNLLNAAWMILDGHVSGADLDAAREKLVKYSYQD